MNHTTKAMLDLLFELARIKEATEGINDKLYELNSGDDFHPRVAPTCGKIEEKISNALDLYFEEITGCESLANHMLYEAGKIEVNGKEFDLTKRPEFEAFIDHTQEKVSA